MKICLALNSYKKSKRKQDEGQLLTTEESEIE